jgi:hypothetical protein
LAAERFYHYLWANVKNKRLSGKAQEAQGYLVFSEAIKLMDQVYGNNLSSRFAWAFEGSSKPATPDFLLHEYAKDHSPTSLYMKLVGSTHIGNSAAPAYDIAHIDSQGIQPYDKPLETASARLTEQAEAGIDAKKAIDAVSGRILLQKALSEVLKTTSQGGTVTAKDVQRDIAITQNLLSAYRTAIKSGKSPDEAKQQVELRLTPFC